MAWRMNISGIDVDAAIPDQMVDLIKEQLRSKSNPGDGVWLQLGDQTSEGSQQVFIPVGATLLFTRTENDPTELLYEFDGGTPAE